ncbi:MAG: ATP-dependent helicase [bacterium]|nr:ATP-dependent helicase [bacterium]
MNEDKFAKQYQKLNAGQKEAVDAIEGSIMVIAGPGTGKTEVLAMRIANILNKTDTPADGVLCLTFTNSGVKAMRERLTQIIGGTGSRVVVSTFHSFALNILEEFYEVLGVDAPPKLLGDHDTVILIDELLEKNTWEYLRPRSGGANNFRDLKSITSLLKREGISSENFRLEIESDIKKITKDPESISSRGKTKGELKKETKEKINRFSRTVEAVKFFDLFELTKKERGLADYDDVLEYMLRLIKESNDVRDSIRERYLYVLVDEHQDSSGVQNEFLRAVWQGTEKPNIFVVGDDRQLIYGFGGASISHFESFQETFEARIIPLLENYRSTQSILDTSATLLTSSIIKEKLKSNTTDNHPLKLVEAEYQRDEILLAGIEIKKGIDNGESPGNFAILVPKNAQVESAISILKDLGLPVAGGGKQSFFSLNETQSLLGVLRVISRPQDESGLANIILDPLFKIPTLLGHSFIRDNNRSLQVSKLLEGKGEILKLGEKFEYLIIEAQKKNLYSLIQLVGKTFFFDEIRDHKSFMKYIEVVRTLLHLALSQIEKNSKITLVEFLDFIDRMESYKENIPLAIFEAHVGVRVLTLHASKGLEFEYVWIAHLDEASLMKGKSMGFTLPEKLSEFAQKKDELSARRELYVAITRAKKFCTLSYAKKSLLGSDLRLAKIIEEMPESTFERINAAETELLILKHDPKVYVISEQREVNTGTIEEIKELVRVNYSSQKVAVTHLNNFFNCPWRWYFRNFLRVPEAESEALQFGDLVHRVIHTMLVNREIESLDIKTELLKELDNMRIFDEHTKNRFLKDGELVLDSFYKDYLKNVKENISTEKSYGYKDSDIPHLNITGKIDLIESVSDNEVEVTDFKTGKSHGSREIEKPSADGRMHDLLRQLTMYSYLIENQKQEVFVSNSKLIFLEAKSEDKDKVYEMRINDKHQEMLKKDLLDFDEALESGSWIDRECNFKPNSFQKECEFCKLKNLISG